MLWGGEMDGGQQCTATGNAIWDGMEEWGGYH